MKILKRNYPNCQHHGAYKKKQSENVTLITRKWEKFEFSRKKKGKKSEPQRVLSNVLIFVADGINSVGDYNSSPGGCRLSVCLCVCVCPHFFSRFTMG